MHLLISLIVGCHLVCVNIGTAAPLLAFVLEWKEWRVDSAAGRAGRAILVAAIVGLALGALLGLVAGGLLWSSGLSGVVMRLPGKVLFGIVEICFSLFLIVAHWIAWRRNPMAGFASRLGRSLMALLACTNLIYHFPTLFTVMSELVHNDPLGEGVISAAQFRQLIMEGSVLPRAVHSALASVAVAGVCLAAQVTFLIGGLSADDRGRLASWGARWALAPTLAQIPVGLWILTRVPGQSQRSLMGQDLFATVGFLGALVLAFWLCHLLAALSLGETSRSRVAQAVVAMIAVVLLMTIVSHRIFRPPSADRGAGHLPRTTYVRGG